MTGNYTVAADGVGRMTGNIASGMEEAGRAR